MKPETRTVNELFERDVHYAVPLYQRPYVWDEEHQWEPLWTDLLVLLDHQSQNGVQAATYSHFLGAIVLEQQTQAPGRIPHYTVIDGQQRLTTLQILLAAAQTVAKQLGADTEAGILSELIVNDPRKAHGDELLKVWPTNVNRSAFRAVVAHDSAAVVADDPSNLIQEAHVYFRERIRDWALDADPADRADRLATLRVTLADLVKLVSITLEPGDNAQVIFETLNARGTPLLALDLVKNAAFHEAARQGCDVDRLHEDVWKPQLDDRLWRKVRRQGRLKRAQGELFLMHWLAMKLRESVPATELFATFRKEILNRQPTPDMDGVIRELNQHAAVYRDFDNQPAGSAEALFFERLASLDVTTFMPLALLLFTDPAVSPECRRRALAAIESWLVRRNLLRLTTKNYNLEVAQLLGRVGENPERADDVVIEHLSAGTVDSDRWPDDAEVVSSLGSRDLYNSIPQARITMVLRAIELSLNDARVDVPGIPSNLSIEHVMPQHWQEHWPLPQDLPADELVARTVARNEHIHRLGNLTLTSGAMNSTLSNGAWPTKQRELNARSRLLLNAELMSRYPVTFDESSIEERTTLLAARICQIWPRMRRV